MDEAEGPRWNLALELIESGGEGIAIWNVLIARDAGSPRSTGQIQVSVFTAWDPKSLTKAAAESEISEAVDRVAWLLDRDGRLNDLFERYGVEWDYRHDYGMGAIRLAELDEAGQPTWVEGFEPVG